MIVQRVAFAPNCGAGVIFVARAARADAQNMPSAFGFEMARRHAFQALATVLMRPLANSVLATIVSGVTNAARMRAACLQKTVQFVRKFVALGVMTVEQVGACVRETTKVYVSKVDPFSSDSRVNRVLTARVYSVYP